MLTVRCSKYLIDSTHARTRTRTRTHPRIHTDTRTDTRALLMHAGVLRFRTELNKYTWALAPREASKSKAKVLASFECPRKQMQRTSKSGACVHATRLGASKGLRTYKQHSLCGAFRIPHSTFHIPQAFVDSFILVEAIECGALPVFIADWNDTTDSNIDRIQNGFE